MRRLELALRAGLATILIVLLIGATFLCVAVAQHYGPPLAVMAVRYWTYDAGKPPPRWTLIDRWFYRWHQSLDLLGRIQEAEANTFRAQVEQRLAYNGDRHDVEWCWRNKCNEQQYRRAIETLDRWTKIDPPGRASPGRLAEP